MRFINKIKYPTKEEILSKTPRIKEKTFLIIKTWKEEEFKNWKDKTNEEKFEKLKKLISYISILGYEQQPNIEQGIIDCYCPNKKTIYLNKDNPSILTALHETSHFLHGKSELTACRWSIHLFKTCFPKLFNNLKWEGHMLIKK